MGSLWMQEVIISILALVVFGPRKLPEIGRALGKAWADFKNSTPTEFKSRGC